MVYIGGALAISFAGLLLLLTLTLIGMGVRDELKLRDKQARGSAATTVVVEVAPIAAAPAAEGCCQFQNESEDEDCEEEWVIVSTRGA